MPIFRYKGFNTDGKEVAGSIEAPGVTDVITRVRSEGIFPSDIIETGLSHKKKFFQRGDETFLPNVTRQLSILTSSGVPLIEALNSLAAENKGFYREMLIAIKERVSGGSGLYRALEDFSDYFPQFYTNMVMAGEQSGTLDTVFARLADFLEKQNAIKAKVRSAMIYPVLMMGVSIVVLSFLFTFVIPKIVKIFRDTKGSLPFITVVLIFLSNLFINYWWALAGGIAAAYIAIRKNIRKHRLAFDRLLLKLPGDIIQSLYYARFARTLGFLLAGGIPILKALKLASKSTGNMGLEAIICKAEQSIAEGHRLSATLEGFPPVFVQLVATGEKSGKLPEALNRTADSYEDMFNRQINRLLSVFEPAMILVMGLIVGFIVLAILLPMFQLNQLIK